MKRLLIFIINCMSMNAVAASYHCELALAHSEDLHTTIASKSISVEDSRMTSQNEGIIYLELEKGRKTVALEVNAFMSGWDNEEEAVLVIRRRESKGSKSQISVISEKFPVKGNAKFTGWFEDYKLDIKCAVEEDEGPKAL